MSITTVTAVLTLIGVLLSAGLFAAGALVDRGTRNSPENNRRSYRLIRIGCWVVAVTWGLIIALSVETIINGL